RTARVDRLARAALASEPTGWVLTAARATPVSAAHFNASLPPTTTLPLHPGPPLGRATLGTTAGVTVTGGADGSASVTIQGTQSAINTALRGLAYKGALNFHGADTLTVTTSDLGHTGSGGPLTDTDTRAVTGTADGDAP